MIRFKMTRQLFVDIKGDLHRRHPFAHERVGFVGAGLALHGDCCTVLAHAYAPVANDDYLDDPSVGAMMGPDAMYKAMAWAFEHGVALFHIHTHGGSGRSGFQRRRYPRKRQIRAGLFQGPPRTAPWRDRAQQHARLRPHLAWAERRAAHHRCVSPGRLSLPQMEDMMSDYARQSFLGADSQQVLAAARIGLVGYSGGGSHYGQQFGHIGVGHFVVVDPKKIIATHRPRFVGNEPEDVKEGWLKVDIAERQIKRGNPLAKVQKLAMTWQEATDPLLECDIIFGAVDSYKERDGLERFCRRNLIPYIDIGMDVRALSDDDYSISGQVVQSLPGGHCMRCCQFITDEKLAREAEDYGAAGPAPQVIWSNGVLASTAVGWGVALPMPLAQRGTPVSLARL